MAEGNLTLHVRGGDKLWAFKNSLEIPLVPIASVRDDQDTAHGWRHGVRMPGTSIPGVITAGTSYRDGRPIFWDVHNSANIVIIRCGGVPFRHEPHASENPRPRPR